MNDQYPTDKPAGSECQDISEEKEIRRAKLILKGWVCLHRKILEHPRWKDDAWPRLWLTLLLLATHTEHETKFGDDVITLKPGQLVTGREQLAEITGLH